MNGNFRQIPRNPDPITVDSERAFAAAKNMEVTGGAFAAAIGEAYLVADTSNRARVFAAFPDLFARYGV
jgi:hypothetical protein